LWCRRHTGRLQPPDSAVNEPYTWAAAVAWAETELKRMRTELEADQDEVDTARLRGQIAALKRLLAQPTQVAQRAQIAAQFADQ
jgi:hypothetical protein